MADDSDKPPVAAGQSTPVDLENPLFFSLENRMFAGVFALPSGKEVQGKFDVAGREIRLEARGGASDGAGGDDCRFIDFMRGTVDGLGDVSLIGCETNTLEFAFAASDLVEAGWDIRTFIEAEKTISHPFLGYLKGYEENLKKLKDGLPGK